MAAVASVNTALLGARRNIANARATQSASSARPVLARSARGLTVRAADGASSARPVTLAVGCPIEPGRRSSDRIADPAATPESANRGPNPVTINQIDSPTRALPAPTVVRRTTADLRSPDPANPNPTRRR